MGWPSWLKGGGGSAPVIVATTKGQVEGFQDKGTGVFRFRGIPYAAPPVGALRFKKPQPHPAWDGVRSCKEFGKTAVQGMSLVVLVFMPKVLAALAYGFLWAAGWNPLDNTDPKRPQSLPRACSEAECLNLNVETTGYQQEEGKPLKPVMVYIHGGAFYLGSSSQVMYQPKDSYLARAGCVVVTINYRLGALGFLRVEGGDYNCGIWDQVAALQWVQDNIANFGGDPNNVTIFGESAGGFSCATLTATRFAGQLFRRAIFQSGCMQIGITKEDMAWLGQAFADALEVPTCALDTVGAATPEALLAAQNKVIKGRRCGMMPLQPVIDGDLLPDRIVECWRKGSAKDLDIMCGYCKAEELFFLKIFRTNFECPDEQTLLKKITFALSPTAMDVPDHEAAARAVEDEMKGWEGGSRAPDHADYWTYKAVDFGSLLKFSIPAHMACETLMLPNCCKSLYLFRFDVHSPLMNGACHVVDLPYVFGNYKLLAGSICPKDEASNAVLCAAVVRAWTNFAYSGDPNTAPAHKPPLAQDAHTPTPHTLPPWPALSAADPDRLMVLDVPLSASHTQSVRLHEHFPTLWRIAQENERALWFHRAPGGPNGGEVAAKEKALQSNL